MEFKDASITKRRTYYAFLDIKIGFTIDDIEHFRIQGKYPSIWI